MTNCQWCGKEYDESKIAIEAIGEYQNTCLACIGSYIDWFHANMPHLSDSGVLAGDSFIQLADRWYWEGGGNE